jgi:hypothetical protein
MTEYVIPDPEPKEIDERLSFELRYLAQNALLRGRPSGDERCENCLTTWTPLPTSRTAGTRKSVCSSGPNGGASGGRRCLTDAKLQLQRTPRCGPNRSVEQGEGAGDLGRSRPVRVNG